MPVHRKLIFAFVTLVATAAFLEGVARVVRLCKGSGGGTVARDRRPSVRRDPVLHHVWAPSVTMVDASRSIPYTLSANAQSWVEEQDTQRVKPPDTYRVFYVGDSNTQGVVDREHKMVELVEQGLNRLAADGGLDIEVVNAGTSSYSFLLYYLQIKNRILVYDPDLVILNIDMTDVVNDFVYRKTLVVDEHGAPAAVLPSAHIDTARYRMTPEGLMELSRVAPLYGRLIESSVFCYYLDRALAHARGWTHADTRVSGILDDRANWLSHRWTPEVQHHVTQSMDVLSRTVSLLQSHGVKVMVTGVPHAPQFTGRWSARPHAVLAETARSRGAAYLNSYEAFRREAPGQSLERYYWAEDPTHLNIAGNALWAKVQLEFLLDPVHRLLPPEVYAVAGRTAVARRAFGVNKTVFTVERSGRYPEAP